MQYRFTKSAGAAVSAAADAAQDNGQRYIGTEHLLLGLLRASDGLAARVLIKNKVDEAKLVELIDKLVGKHEVLEDGEYVLLMNYTPMKPEDSELSAREAHVLIRPDQHRAFAYCAFKRVTVWQCVF